MIIGRSGWAWASFVAARIILASESAGFKQNGELFSLEYVKRKQNRPEMPENMQNELLFAIRKGKNSPFCLKPALSDAGEAFGRSEGMRVGADALSLETRVGIAGVCDRD